MAYFIALPDGRYVQFDDEVPQDAAKRQIYDAFPEYFTPEQQQFYEREKFQNETSAFGRGLRSAYESTTGNMGALYDYLTGGDFDTLQQDLKATEEAASKENPYPVTFGDVQTSFSKSFWDGLQTLGSYTGELGGASVPYAAGAIAGGAAGTLLGPEGTAIGAAAPFAGAALASFPQFFADNVARQVQEGARKEDEISWLGAAAAGGAEAGLNAIGPVVSGVFGKAAQGAVIRQLLDAAGRVPGGRLAAAGIATSQVEGATEVLQNALERLQAGLEPFDEGETIENYVGGALLGLLLSAGGTAGHAIGGKGKDATEGAEEPVEAPPAARGPYQPPEGPLLLPPPSAAPRMPVFDIRPEQGETPADYAARAIRVAGAEFPEGPYRTEFQNGVYQVTNEEGQPVGQPFRSAEAAQEVVNTYNEQQTEIRNERAIREALKRTKQTETEALMAAARETITPVGTFGIQEVGPDVAGRVNNWRVTRGLAALDDFTLEDLADARVSQSAIDELIKIRRPVSGAEPVTPGDVTNLAVAKNIAVDDENFRTFAKRTTGGSSLERMNQTQLQTLYSVLADLPANEEPVTLPVVAREQFTPQQYRSAVDALQQRGSYSEKALKEATGLTRDEDLKALRKALVRRGDLVERSEKDYRLPEVLPAERQTVPGDLPEGTTRAHTIRELPVEKVRVMRNGKNVGTFTNPAEARDRVSRIRERETEKGEKPADLSIEPVEETGFAVMENRYDDKGNYLGQAIVDTRRTRGEAEKVAREMDGIPEAPPKPHKMPPPKALEGRLSKVTDALDKFAKDRGVQKLGTRVRLTSTIEIPNTGEKARGATVMTDSGERLVLLATDALTPDMSIEQIIDELGGWMDHEIIHALRMAGVLSPDSKEWNALANYVRKAKNGTTGETFYQFANRRYRGMPGYNSEDAIVEEAIAEAFRSWAQNRRSVGTPAAGIFQRIAEWFRNLVNRLPKEIFEAIESGSFIEDRIDAVRTKAATSVAPRYAADQLDNVVGFDAAWSQVNNGLPPRMTVTDEGFGFAWQERPQNGERTYYGSYDGVWSPAAVIRKEGTSWIVEGKGDFQEDIDVALAEDQRSGYIDDGGFRTKSAAAEWVETSIGEMHNADLDTARSLESLVEQTSYEAGGAPTLYELPSKEWYARNKIAEATRKYHEAMWRQTKPGATVSLPIGSDRIAVFRKGSAPVEKPRYAVTAKLGARVPPVIDDGSFDIVRQRTEGAIGEYLHMLGRSKKPLPLIDTSIFDIRVKLQDKMLSVKEMLEVIKETGGQVSDLMDSYMAEQLYHGRVVERIRQRERNLYVPLMNAIKQSPNVALKDVEDYLYARHARERNRELRAAGSKVPNPAGISDDEAVQTLNRLTDEGKLPELERIAGHVDSIVKDTTNTRIEGGLLSPEQAAQSPYQHYVPLRGFAEEDLDPELPFEENMRARSGRGFSVAGREDRSPTGRQRKAGDILGHLLLQNEEAVIRAEKNAVAQSFVRLVEANPDAGFGEILTKAPTRATRGADGRIRQVVDMNYRRAPNIAIAKFNGKEVVVDVADPRVARAIKMDYPSTTGPFVNMLGKLNRYLATINTAWNPEFIVSNFARDLQTAGILTQQYNIPGLLKGTISSVPQALKGIRAVLRDGRTDTPWAQAFMDLQDDGGTTEFLGIRDLETQIAKIRSELGAVNAPRFSGARKLMGSIAKFAEDYNKIAENGVRLAAYKTAREAGVSRKQAAFLAKNLTVNFNKGGEWKSLMNSLYLFYNASLQGTMVLVNGLRSKRVQKIVGGVVLAGATQDMINRLMSGDNDDNGILDYDEIPDYVLEHNLVFMDPFGLVGENGYIAIPMPYGFNAFYNAGRGMAAVLGGSQRWTPGKTATSIASTFVNAFNPLGGTESFLNFVSPTIIDPIVDLYENRDFAGRAIVPERPGFGVPTPQSQLYWNSTAAPFKWVAEELNSLTGGNAVRSGTVDISPEVLEHAYDYVLGALGAFVMRTGNAAAKGLSGDLENIEIGEIPFMRRVVGSITERANQETYYTNAEEVLLVGKEREFFKDTGNFQALRNLMQSRNRELRYLPIFKKADSELQKLRKKLKELRENTGISETTRNRLEDQYRAQMDNIMRAANRAYLGSQ